MDPIIEKRLLEALGYETGVKSAEERALDKAREADRVGLDYFVPPSTETGVWRPLFPRHEEWLTILNMPLNTPEEIADFYYKLLAFYNESYSSKAHRLMSIQLASATIDKMASLSDETRWILSLLVSSSYDELDKKLETTFEDATVDVSDGDESGETPAESPCETPVELANTFGEVETMADGHPQDQESTM